MSEPRVWTLNGSRVVEHSRLLHALEQAKDQERYYLREMQRAELAESQLDTALGILDRVYRMEQHLPKAIWMDVDALRSTCATSAVDEEGSP
jgi:hypothetical protein